MLNTNVLTMRNIIQNYRFIIPTYQRGYSWSTEQISELWNDIIEITEVRQQPDTEYELRNHFLGSMLTTSITGRNEMMLHIIDGQQRMTSLTILIAVLNDLCTQNRVLSPIFGEIFSNRPAPLIQLNEGNDYFQNTILIPSRAASPHEARSLAFRDTPCETLPEQNIRDNYKELYKLADLHISRDNPQQRAFKLSELLGTFLDYLYLVRIHVPNNANTIRIFRTLNARGLELSDGDLTKSVIFQSVLHHPNDSQSIARLWEQTFEQIEPDQDLDAISEYLRHYYISTNNYIKMKALPETYGAYLAQPSAVSGVPRSIDLMHRLNEEAGHYNTIVQGNSESTEINERLTTIRKILKVTATYPALLAGYSRWNRHPITLAKFLTLIEHFTFRHFHISSYRQIPAFETFMSKIAVHIRTNSEPLPQIKQWLKEASPDSSFVSAFKIAGFGNATMFRYIYWKLEAPPNIRLAAFLSNDFKVNPIMPKSPNDHFTRADINQEYVKRIGNVIVWPTKLTLTKQLQPVLNQSTTSFRHSISTAQTALQHHRTWGMDAIDSRQNLLSEIARTAWSLDLDV